MFYRRKIILSLIQLLSGKVEKLRFQKLLFLYSETKNDGEYDFIPFKYGCYSFSAAADLNTMTKKGFLEESETNYTKADKIDYFNTLKPSDKSHLQAVVNNYGKMSTSTLIVHTYINYPFYATKSIVAKDILSNYFYQRVIDAKPKETTPFLFTIGYQGVSLEKYLHKLLSHNVRVLVDVRKNPLSMKFGFSKTLLKKYCESLDIKYIHIPDVGIESNKRRDLNTQKDYDNLFEYYRTTTLKENINSQLEILEILNKYRRIALTCFESNICQCHRLHLSNSLNKINPQLLVNHI